MVHIAARDCAILLTAHLKAVVSACKSCILPLPPHLRDVSSLFSRVFLYSLTGAEQSLVFRPPPRGQRKVVRRHGLGAEHYSGDIIECAVCLQMIVLGVPNGHLNLDIRNSRSFSPLMLTLPHCDACRCWRPTWRKPLSLLMTSPSLSTRCG